MLHRPLTPESRISWRLERLVQAARVVTLTDGFTAAPLASLDEQPSRRTKPFEDSVISDSY